MVVTVWKKLSSRNDRDKIGYREKGDEYLLQDRF